MKLRIFSFIMILLLMASAGLLACDEEETGPKEVVFGALLPLSGDLSSAGESDQAALDIAVEEINDLLAEMDSNVRIRIIVEDTQTDPLVAYEKLKSLAGEGVTLFIGPSSSEEVEAVRTYADENGLLLVSHSSTASSLAIPGDNVFRFVPNDKYQAEVITRLMWQKHGIKVIIPMWRGDLWGDGLAEWIKLGFFDFGGIVIDGVRYDPDTKDFSVEVASLSSKVSQAVSQYGAEAVGVELISFQEVVPIFIQAQNDTMLSSVRWYGSDGTALIRQLIENEQAAQFAVETSFLNSMFGPAETERREAIAEQISTVIGRIPEATALAAYDAIWVLTRAYIETNKHDLDSFKTAFLRAAESYFGTTAWTGLNEAGDRDFSIYDFWTVSEDNGSFQWELITRRMPIHRDEQVLD